MYNSQQVYLPAIVGHVPTEMVQCISAFLDVCYIICRADITTDTLQQFDIALAKFHQHREVFRTTGVRPDGFNLPRQHALSHYRHLIEEFGAPGGICSSITESRHITAVKKPWRRSNRFEALQQMLVTNQRLDKLAAARIDFISRGMLPSSYGPPPGAIEPAPNHDEREDDAEPTDEPYVTGNVVLARTRGEFL